MIILLSILFGIIIILIFFIDWGNAKLEFDLNDADNIIGIGKATGLYVLPLKKIVLTNGSSIIFLWRKLKNII